MPGIFLPGDSQISSQARTAPDGRPIGEQRDATRGTIKSAASLQFPSRPLNVIKIMTALRIETLIECIVISRRAR
jgi:hypothetical protein